uniref:tetratricopeptide repeat protein n=1 Tax=Microvirga soli TaxID=1854496 RepID=UPI00191EDBF7
MRGEPRTLMDLSRQARSRGDRTASLCHLRAALAADPNQISFKIEVAADLRELGRLDEAEAVLQEILKQAPQHAGARIWLGHVARRRGDRAAALTYFEAAAELEPHNLPVKLEVAADLRELGRLDEAEAVLQEILKQAPQHAGARIALGHVARRRGDRAAALTYFEAAAELEPHNLPVKLEVA